MAYRFTNTQKWQDHWYLNLSTEGKLLWNYLCDNCDICGYMEFVPDVISSQTGIKSANLETLTKGLGKGLLWNSDNTGFIVKNYLKHQKNLPIGGSPFHKGIISRWFEISHKFPNCVIDKNIGITDDVERVTLPLPNPKLTLTIPLPKGNQTLSIGLPNPIGKGKGKGNKEGGVGETIPPTPLPEVPKHLVHLFENRDEES